MNTWLTDYGNWQLQEPTDTERASKTAMDAFSAGYEAGHAAARAEIVAALADQMFTGELIVAKGRE